MVATEDNDEQDLPPVTVGAAASTDANPGPTFPVGPPFGPSFFRTVLKDRVRERCTGREEIVPVVQLRLADGTTFDVCHIPTLKRRWFAVEVFQDAENSEDVDLVFIPYETVTRVTISERSQRERPLGFRVDS